MVTVFNCGDLSFLYSDCSSEYPFHECLTAGFYNVTMSKDLHEVKSGSCWDEVRIDFSTMVISFYRFPNNDEGDDMVECHKIKFKITC